MIDKREIFRSHFPHSIYFGEDHLKSLPIYLNEKGIISSDEKIIGIEKPGEGNMNFVQRIRTNKRSFILKQSRPWVEKYPDIKAPPERIHVEASYYKLISQDSFFSDYSPEIICYDPENLILITQDLGEGSDFTDCYKRWVTLKDAHIEILLKYISHLHNKNWGDAQDKFPLNLELRKLNHQHIFVLPYQIDNGFDLDSIQAGLQQLSLSIKHDESLKLRIKEFGNLYLDSGPILLHGDYYPGSWLKIGDQVKVIDPEFSFFGFAEFDIGVMTAHFLMSGMDLSEVRSVLTKYDGREDFEPELLHGFCGTEILRRIIGLAQLPLDLSPDEKEKLLDLAQEFIKSSNNHKLL